MRAALKNAAALVLILAFLAAVGLTIGCPIKNLVGLPCPGCGMTRACLSLLRLDFRSAVRYNPLCLLVPFLCAMFVAKDTSAGRRFWSSAPVLAVLTAVVLLVYAVRMIFFFPGASPMDFNGGALFVKLIHKLLLH